MIKFGQRYEITVSPRLVLDVEKMLEEWVISLAAKEDVDLDREAIGMSQKIILFIAESSPQEVGSP